MISPVTVAIGPDIECSPAPYDEVDTLAHLPTAITDNHFTCAAHPNSNFVPPGIFDFLDGVPSLDNYPSRQVILNADQLIETTFYSKGDLHSVVSQKTFLHMHGSVRLRNRIYPTSET